MADRVLLLTDAEAAFLRQALDTWSTIYAGDHSPEVDAFRMDRLQIRRKLEGQYRPDEVQDAVQAALDLME